MSTQPVAIDPETISLEELAKLAAGQSAFTPAQPRDEAGRFVAPTPEPVVDPAVVVEDETDLDPNDVVHNGELVYRLETDGEEVYYGHGPDSITRERDANRQLREAKVHANRKIREQNQALKVQEQAKQAMTADERFVLQQRLQTEPDLVLNEAIEKRLASDPRIKAAEQLATQQSINAVTTQWVTDNPEYHAVPINGKRLWKQMQYNGVQGVPTPADITKAYQELKADGLLQEKPADPPAAPPVVVAPPARPRASGLPARSTVVAPVAPPGPSREDLYNMPLEKLAELANRQARGL